MEALLKPNAHPGQGMPLWKNPSAWFREKNLDRRFWIFFTIAFFFDAGFCIYVFLFNLYLLDAHFTERAIGLVGGASTLGSVVGLLPAGMVAKKIGLRPLMLGCLVAAPVLSACRVIWVWEPAQIGLAFIAGLAMCSWGICFLPAVARTTTEKNRTTAFSLIFSASIATAALGGVVCGYLQQWLGMTGIHLQALEVKRLILLGSCGVAALGLIPALKLELSEQGIQSFEKDFPQQHGWYRGLTLPPFLIRFLPLMALWSAVLAGFNPFANIYLSRDLHIPITQIGLIFSTAQIVQFFLGLAAPLVFRAVGLINGIALMQIFTGATLALMAATHNGKLAIALYLIFSAAQWMSAPGLYNLLMNETPDKDRSMASAMTLFCNALAGSAATAAAGILFTRFGHPPVLFAIAAVALILAVLFRLLMPARVVPREAAALTVEA